MLTFNPQQCLVNARKADVADLLDRVTAYRLGMEPEALEVLEGELRRRGVSAAEISARQEECRQECVFDATGVALTCSRCRRPAVARGWGWHRLWGRVPVFPEPVRYCKEHRPGPEAGAS
jgi:hypothetical protein